MRSSGGTKSGLDVSVVAFTKSTIACFAGPSFHEGRVSVAEGASASAVRGRSSTNTIADAANAASRTRRLMLEQGFDCMFASTQNRVMFAAGGFGFFTTLALYSSTAFN